ncbi:tRNA (guanosine(37)-N1)-methyltransferase TrmD [Patescibacteria group bacterium AH-259-L05]|nr:tRNA (guanosine(37)-N1)-methyltransferase TrmD [Patescibacteria group bacterium AH-259-L05]
MQFDIITIFPDIFDLYFNTSIIKRAQEKKLVVIKIHDLRKWTADKHKTVDDRPYGGGPGMILKVRPIYEGLKKIKAASPLSSRASRGETKKEVSSRAKQGTNVILLTPKGKQFDQKMAKRFSKLDRVILVCGRYEGVDERVTKFIDEQISVGPYVLTGGELPAMIMIDTITRLIPGVISPESLQEETFSFRKIKKNKLEIKNSELEIFHEYPQYTRPEVFTYKDTSGRIKSFKVPNVLLSGNHKKIKQWREKYVR